MIMNHYDKSIERNHNPNWSYIPDHTYGILIIGGSGSAKTNGLLNFINIKEQMLAKFICTSKIHSNQSINDVLTEEKKKGLKN